MSEQSVQSAHSKSPNKAQAGAAVTLLGNVSVWRSACRFLSSRTAQSLLSVRDVCLASFMLVLAGLSSSALGQSTTQTADITAIGEVLDAYHAAAAAGEWSDYFDLLSEDAVFLGTDAAERWPKEVFRRYAEDSAGWVYHPQERHINLTPDGQSAWFDELLSSASYGTSRGTGVLIKTASGWRISQYHLTFPIPNELANAITDEIKAFEAQASQ